jgi:Asp-tRNA(Asn)/Glu-tRNA(Gln) amidotransferase A subunit family amidase
MTLLAAGCTGLSATEETMVVVRREDARFVPLDPARPDEAQVAVLRGDPDKGPSAALLRLQKYPGALHYHTYGYDLLVLAITSHPAISVPAGFTSDDPALPVGLQIVGRYRDDLGVLQLAHAFEQATQFWNNRPAVESASS